MEYDIEPLIIVAGLCRGWLTESMHCPRVILMLTDYSGTKDVVYFG